MASLVVIFMMLVYPHVWDQEWARELWDWFYLWYRYKPEMLTVYVVTFILGMGYGAYWFLVLR